MGEYDSSREIFSTFLCRTYCSYAFPNTSWKC
jgi:hypothetical protein